MQKTPSSPELTSGSSAGSGAEFVEIRRGARMLLLDSRFCKTVLEGILFEDGAGLSDRYKARVVPSAATSRVFRLAVEVGDRVVTLYHKDYLQRSFWDAVKHIVRPSRARRAFHASLMLAAEGFGVPEIVALGETHSGLLAKSCFLVTREVSQAERVVVLLAASPCTQTALSLRARRDLLRTLGGMVGRMHQAGIVHGDLRLGNVLARRERDQWMLFLLDNERTRRWPRLPARLRLKNLVQVNMLTKGISATDRLRFFLAYIAECPQLRPRHKQWARRIHARTAQRLAKYRRRSANGAAHTP
jgi:hypothetical protein